MCHRRQYGWRLKQTSAFFRALLPAWRKSLHYASSTPHACSAFWLDAVLWLADSGFPEFIAMKNAIPDWLKYIGLLRQYGDTTQPSVWENAEVHAVVTTHTSKMHSSVSARNLQRVGSRRGSGKTFSTGIWCQLSLLSLATQCFQCFQL